MSIQQGSKFINDASDVVSVVYPEAFLTPSNEIFTQVINVSADPIKLAITATVTEYSTTGFTVGLSQATNTANYQLIWTAYGTISPPEETPTAEDEVLTPEELKQFALDPKRVTSDGQTVENHSLRDLMDYDRYLREKKASNNKLPLRFMKTIPGKYT